MWIRSKAKDESKILLQNKDSKRKKLMICNQLN